jgi:cholinesterase
MNTLLLDWALAATALADATAPLWTVGQEVTTTSGKVLGRAADRAGYSEVSQYAGIPYAIPPVGPLRWAPAQAFRGNATLSATRWMNDCVQPTGAGSAFSGNPFLKGYSYGMGGNGGHVYSEDCLGLTIWTKPQSGEKKKAVMVWIHGGGFSTGNANALFMDGARFANDQDVVLVSVHYRINILGFPNAPGLTQQNLGLGDQRLALEWVRDNIDNFGGDVKRITIFGESAGAGAVDMFAYAWPRDPIIAGIIAQSGSASLRPATGGNGQPHDAWYKISDKVGCGGRDTGAKTIDCMRGQPVEALMKQLDAVTTGPGITPFGPVADSILPADISAASAAGNFIKVPLLVGHNDHESGLTEAIMQGVGGKNPFAAAEGSSSGGGMTGPLPKGMTPATMRDSMMGCGSGRAAEARIKQNVPAWRYRYMGVFNNTSVGPASGAYHSGEIPIVFGTTELRPNVNKDTPDEAEVVKSTMHAWASFAKDPTKGLLNLGWPIYDPASKKLLPIIAERY